MTRNVPFVQFNHELVAIIQFSHELVASVLGGGGLISNTSTGVDVQERRCLTSRKKVVDQYGLAGEKAYKRHMLFETAVIP